MAVCYSDWPIMGLRPFCTNPSEVTVMCADTTYTLGDLYVIPMSYRHLMLDDIHTGKLPGPVLVHQQMKYTSTAVLLPLLMLIKVCDMFKHSEQMMILLSVMPSVIAFHLVHFIDSSTLLFA